MRADSTKLGLSLLRPELPQQTHQIELITYKNETALLARSKILVKRKGMST